MLDRIALIFTVLGALNWGSVGLFQFDAIAWAFGGPLAIASRIAYTVIALSAIWCISLFFREREEVLEHKDKKDKHDYNDYDKNDTITSH